MEHTHNEKFDTWHAALYNLETAWLTSLNLLLQIGEKDFFFIFMYVFLIVSILFAPFALRILCQALLLPLLWFKLKVTTVSAKKVILYSAYLNSYSFELNPSQLLLVFFLMVKVTFLLLFSQILLGTKVDSPVTEWLKSNDFIGSVPPLFSFIQMLFYIL